MPTPLIVYHYDPITLVYTNRASEADADPLEPGRFLFPAHSTHEAPPFIPNPRKQQAVFRDGAWVVELIPVEPPLAKNLASAPEKMWQRTSVKEALKGGVT